MPGEQFGGVEPQEIARHEYGHHVAASRINPPWSASTYGPKRWSSAMGICARTKAGTAFPDDYTHYALSPSEAFAESYRVLTTAPGILGPDAARPSTVSVSSRGTTLRAIAHDVTRPGSRPLERVRGRCRRASAVSLTTLATPLDGDRTSRCVSRAAAPTR